MRVPVTILPRAALAVLLLCCTSPLHPQTVTYSQFEPPVIPHNRRDPVILRAKVSGSVSQLVFEFGGVTDLPMRDDGQYPDTLAGDLIFAVALPAQEVVGGVGGGYPDLDVHRGFKGYLKPMNGSTVLARYNIFAEILAPEIPILPVTALAADAQRTEVLVNFHDPQFFNDFNLDRISSRFYQFFPDEFDFLLFVYHPSYFLNRSYSGRRNDTSGIGVSIFSNLGNTGSAGRLQGFVRFPNTDLFDGASTGYSHELGHRWINFLPVAPLSWGSPHWPLSSLASGTMGWSTKGGQGLNYSCGRPTYVGPVFTDLDLYLMGMLPAGKVGNHVVFNDQADPSIQACNYTGAITTVSLSQITAVVGNRVPDSTVSQKRFRVGTILVSRDGLLDQNAMSFYSFFAKRAEEIEAVFAHEGFTIGEASPFAVQTRMVGSLDTSLVDAGPLSFSKFAANFTADETEYGFAQVVGLRNNTNAPISLYSITATSGFEQTNDCGETLAAGSFCRISITAPPVLQGRSDGTLTVQSSAGAPSVLPLSGFGPDLYLDLGRPTRPRRNATELVVATQPERAEAETRVPAAPLAGTQWLITLPETRGGDPLRPCHKSSTKRENANPAHPDTLPAEKCRSKED